MKKFVCIVLSAFSLCAILSGCSSGTSQDKEDEIVSERESIRGELNDLDAQGDDIKEDQEGQDRTEKGTVLLDKNGVKITYTGIVDDEEDSYRDAAIHLIIENNSGYDIGSYMPYMYINGIETDRFHHNIGGEDYWIPTGSSVNGELFFDLDEAGITKLSQIQDIEFSIGFEIKGTGEHLFGDTGDSLTDTERISINF